MRPETTQLNGSRCRNERRKESYAFHLVPIFAGFIALLATRHLGLIATDLPAVCRAMAPVLFMLSACFALILPLLYRMAFIHRNRYEKKISERIFTRFEKNLIHIAMVTPYLALVGYFLKISTFHFTGSVLMGLYAVYYYFPSQRRMASERRIFRVRQTP